MSEVLRNEIDPEFRMEKPAFEAFTFTELQEAHQELTELAKKTFQQTENGFRNVEGDGIYVQETAKGCKLSEISRELKRVHEFIVTHADSVLAQGAQDKATMMQAIKKMLVELGNRVIE